MSLSPRLRAVATSPLESVRAEIARLRARGADVVDLTPVRACGPAPGEVIDAAVRALEDGAPGDAAGGDEALRAALCAGDPLLRDARLYPDEIVVASGAGPAAAALARVLFAPGDDVLLAAPSLPHLPALVRLAGGRPVPVPVEAAGPGAFASSLTPDSRGVILGRPACPSGAVLGPSVLRDLAALAAERNLWLVSDETLAPLVFDGAAHAPGLDARGEAGARMVVVGASGRHLDRPWGPSVHPGAPGPPAWIAAPPEVINGLLRVLSHAGGSVGPVAGAAVRAALPTAERDERTVRSQTEARRNVLCDALAAVPGLTCPRPAAGETALVGLEELNRRTGPTSATEIANRLLHRGGVATLAGDAFGARDRLVVSFAREPGLLREGARRIRRALEP